MMPGQLADTSRGAWRSRAGMILLLVMVLPPIRRATETSMTAHMLVQYTSLLLAGGLLIEGLPARWLRAVQRWNELGIAGLMGSSLALAVLMVPRVLDLALTDVRVECLKLVALVLTGAALRLSWQRAGTIVQVFFLGNVLPMMVVVGTLYQDSATRVCNAYRLDDQQDLGLALVWVAVGVLTLWLLRLSLRSTGPRESPVA
jgi:hypothetical protein